jgi:hypothetical protein
MLKMKEPLRIIEGSTRMTSWVNSKHLRNSSRKETFYDASITLLPKSDKDMTSKGKYRHVSLINIVKKKNP